MNSLQLILFIFFVSLNLIILFKLKAKNDLIISTITSHLLIILIFNITLKSIELMQELVVAIVIFSISTLFLISQKQPQHKESISKTKMGHDSNQSPIKRLLQKLPTPILASLICFVIASATILILVIHELPEINKIVAEKKIQRQKDSSINPMILPSHPVHIAVKKFYLGKKFDEKNANYVNSGSTRNQLKIIKLKDDLQKHFLLRRSSEILLAIIFIISGSLVVGSQKLKT